MIFIGWSFVLIGLFFVISGVICLFRFPDFYTKLHAASLTECAGIPLCCLGLACLQTDLTSSAKLLLILLLILLLNPVSSFALGRASLLYKIDKDGRIK